MESAAPQPLESGTNTTGSSLALTPEQELQRELRLNNGASRLARMVAIDDLDSSLGLEREWVDADAHANHKELWDESMKSHVGKDGQEDMKVMSAGDVTMHHHYAAPPVVAQPLPQAVAPKPATSTLAKWALPAALAAAGIGGPLAWKLPEIVSAFAPKPSGDIFDEYDLVVGPPKEESTGTP